MLKLVSWNIRHRPETWRTLLDSGYDIALLQEACAPPSDIASRFDVGAERWKTEGADGKRSWRTALVGLNLGLRLDRIAARSIAEALPGELAVSRIGTVSAAHVEDPETREKYTLISMYALWEHPHASTDSSWIYADGSAHRLISDISALVGQQRSHRVLAAGDLNILYGHGDHGSPYWGERYRTIFDRLGMVGLQFVGPQSPNGRQADPWPSELPRESLNVPTFRTNLHNPDTATRQLDFVFASSDIAADVKTRALNTAEEWGPSDHCRVTIELG